MNILSIPFLAPIIFFRNPRISEFALKMQYIAMISAYFILAMSLMALIAPILYIKIVINSLYCISKNKRQEYPYQNLQYFISSLFLGPAIIIVSIIIDLFTVPNLLFKPSEELESKYQLYQDRLGSH